MTKVTLSRIEHRGKARIKVDFPYDAAIIQTIKQLDGAKWSQTKRCWHLPYNKATYQALQKVFDVSILNPKQQEIAILPIKEKVAMPARQNIEKIPKENTTFITGNKIVIAKANNRWLKVYVPYDKKGWIVTIRNIIGRKWKVEEKCWLIPNVKESYRSLKQQIGMEYLHFQFTIPVDIPETFQHPYQYRATTKPKKSFIEQLSKVQQLALVQLDERLLLLRACWEFILWAKKVSFSFCGYQFLKP